jgi:hypothetical protein
VSVCFCHLKVYCGADHLKDLLWELFRFQEVCRSCYFQKHTSLPTAWTPIGRLAGVCDFQHWTGRCACSSSHEGTSYGPVFGTNDVIGCLLNQVLWTNPSRFRWFHVCHSLCVWNLVKVLNWVFCHPLLHRANVHLLFSTSVLFYTRHFLPVMLFSVLQMDHTISYTKNGTNLGVAFRNVKGNCFFLHLLMYWICTTCSQSGYGSQTCRMNNQRSITCTCAGLVLYPTVGLRTPGEKVEANFGAKPFVFNLEGFQQVWALIAPLHLASMVWWPCRSQWHPFMPYSA